ncbi:hypothetical protein [Haloechinothrix halophila]|uniref:hypothetical protein n=1 Tax=Haloechinothrix halophila TaxID=1069073 RepID=UPI0012F9EE37|nr:hypothetical protein [Haloechinothrix halophila]
MAALPDETAMLYRIAALGERGRVAEQAVVRALGWEPGQRLQFSLVSNTAVAVHPDAAGMFTLARRGHIPLPVAARRWCHLQAGDRVLLAAAADRGVLIVYTARALDDLLMGPGWALNSWLDDNRELIDDHLEYSMSWSDQGIDTDVRLAAPDVALTYPGRPNQPNRHPARTLPCTSSAPTGTQPSPSRRSSTAPRPPRSPTRSATRCSAPRPTSSPPTCATPDPPRGGRASLTTRED